MNDVRRIHHLRGLSKQPEGRSLSFALMAAGNHFDEGEDHVGRQAAADAFWLMHKGTHERLTDLDMIVAIRRFAGFSWSPEAPEGEAA